MRPLRLKMPRSPRSAPPAHAAADDPATIGHEAAAATLLQTSEV